MTIKTNWSNRLKSSTNLSATEEQLPVLGRDDQLFKGQDLNQIRLKVIILPYVQVRLSQCIIHGLKILKHW